MLVVSFMLNREQNSKINLFKGLLYQIFSDRMFFYHNKLLYISAAPT